MFDIERILENASEEIGKKAEEKLTESIINSIEWNLRENIEKVANEYFNENIKPKITAALLEKEDLIIEKILSHISDIGDIAGKALVAKATKNMENSWQLSKVHEGLFK